mmetsp:Transcript_76579/g.147879  ORF Transcript_76579/g.147879 Transcript_76579/m.147879 type:complete len:451 (-) Transcript_76579:125-1477(-)
MDMSWATTPVLQQKRRSPSASSSVGVANRSRRQSTPSTPVAASFCPRLRATGSQTPSASPLPAGCNSSRPKPQPVPCFSTPRSAAPPPGTGTKEANTRVMQDNTPPLAGAASARRAMTPRHRPASPFLDPGASRVTKGNCTHLQRHAADGTPDQHPRLQADWASLVGECSSRSLSPQLVRTPLASHTRHRSEDIQRCTRLAEFFGRRLDELQLRMALACWRLALASVHREDGSARELLLVGLLQWRRRCETQRTQHWHQEKYKVRVLDIAETLQAPCRRSRLKAACCAWFLAVRCSANGRGPGDNLAQLFGSWARATLLGRLEHQHRICSKMRQTAVGRAMFRLGRAGARLAAECSAWHQRVTFHAWRSWVQWVREQRALLSCCRAICAWRTPLVQTARFQGISMNSRLHDRIASSAVPTEAEEPLDKLPQCRRDELLFGQRSVQRSGKS